MSPGPRLAKRIDSSVRRFCKCFHDAGYECFLVGGAVRDLLLGRRVVDYDFATNALPEDVIGLFHRTIPTGIDHGTVTVLYRHYSFEVTTYRGEGDYSDSRHPDSVEYLSSVKEDLRRRDFTMNAIAYDPVSRAVVDPHGGQADIAARLIRAIGDPCERFREDALRMLRLARFAAQLLFQADQSTREAIPPLAEQIRRVSPERIREELIRILGSDQPSIAFSLLEETGLLKQILPELVEGVGIEQRGNHRFDVFEHSIRSCDAAPAGNLEVRLAALLHDIGKPRALADSPEGGRIFHGHDTISAAMTDGILERYRFSNETRRRVVHLVRHHMFAYTSIWTDAAVRRFVRRIGQENIDDLFLLYRADAVAVAGNPTPTRESSEFRSRIQAVLDRGEALTVRDLAIDGNDIIGLGVPKGPLVGVTLEFLLESVLDDPGLNEPKRLRTIAKRFYEERLRDP
jgi:tRNA nucleotidyltransferase (CCA-adding enzyme)